MSVLFQLLAAVLDRPFDDTLRGDLSDELTAAGNWDWTFLLPFVLAHPDSDGPRLLIADWLAEGGPAEVTRAAFIRAQSRLSRALDVCGGGAGADPQVGPLTEEVGRLAARLGERLGDPAVLTGPVTVVPGGECVTVRAADGEFDYLRGFVARVRLPTGAFLASAAGLFARHPITTVRLTDKTPMPVLGGAWWWADSCLAPSEPACLARYVPPELYQALTGAIAPDGQSRQGVSPADLTFPTAAAAVSALSSACVTYGRAMAADRPAF
ncbi:TIGR02996 domain-containing protein [Gemmata sp. JC673]|uniref:TIGR02996 domain-containing protein n=1 Tax=Gemmata algarum TaxID=2975278 RepID=A0ABU5F838_9BACT|nr:TIGR02996 domain-containing protein [Gemmata algarum]MDY3563763.1 TIGR02996 domain-containing protein [Gemmata algarum]